MKFTLFASLLVVQLSASTVNQSLANNLEGYSPEVKAIVAAAGIKKAVKNAQGNYS